MNPRANELCVLSQRPFIDIAGRRRETVATSKRQAASGKRSTAKRAGSTRTAAKKTGGEEFVCPECGRTFGRAAALGAHRSRAHGVKGRSARATSRRARSVPSAPAGAASSKRASARRGASANSVDRDSLLKSLFPDGIPAREEVVRAATTWLDEAERLARMR
jgi:uncharacterized C2H2 Zn-finger protein